MKNLLKEPLFHFVLMGIALFVLYGWVSDRSDSQETIYFDDYDMNNLIASWEMQWKRLPTDEELKSLVQQNIRQEVFYQEALKMNLDHNDEIIKRRLAQKMNFLSNDLATLKEPTEDELRKYYEDNREKYLLSPIYSFYQISFRSDSRNNPQADAKKYLETLDDKGPEKLKDQGDKLPFPYYFESTDSKPALKSHYISEGKYDVEVFRWNPVPIPNQPIPEDKDIYNQILHTSFSGLQSLGDVPVKIFEEIAIKNDLTVEQVKTIYQNTILWKVGCQMKAH